MKRICFFACIGALMVCSTSPVLWAQATAQISGTARDQSGAVLPGVEIRATETETGIARDVVTNETGSYVLPNLPIGPYRLEASLPGFRTYAQTGIVLQVNSSPTVNVVLQIGQVSEQVEVQANAALVETRTVGVGSVVENTRILELPLNGRQIVELIALAGASTPAPLVNPGSRDPFTKSSVSVAGGLNTGLNYTLDGASHNNPFDNSNLSTPFPDALQEFKVETGATGAQNGVKASGTVSLVTKSGTNEFHGDLFEFVRNGMFNARNAFATKRDTIKRNQFGGTFGGAIMKNKLFFFGGYQGTILRQDPPQSISYVPTPAMFLGDFTTFASPACNAGRQMTLRAPFVNNRMDPALFSPAAVRLANKLPKTSDPCGKVIYGNPSLNDDHMEIGRVDYQHSAGHSLFSRYMRETLKIPPAYDVNHFILSSQGNPTNGTDAKLVSFVVGDTYLFGANVVNAFRLTANHFIGGKIGPNIDGLGIGSADLGIKGFSYEPHHLETTVTGGFVLDHLQGPSKMALFGANDDVSVLRGNHQIAVGGNAAIWWVNSYSTTYNHLHLDFTGQTTGLGMADFFTGNASSLQMGTSADQHKRASYLGLYANDTWKLSRKLTLNYGLRWEPYFPIVNLDGSAIHYDEAALRKGIRTNRFTNVPPGLFFTGDPGVPGLSGLYKQWMNFSPRVGLAWDATGDGRTSVRVSGGTFYDYQSTYYMTALTNAPPWNPRITRGSVSFDDPWANQPGGDPFPLPYGLNVGRDVPWPFYGLVNAMDYNSPNAQVAQWNLSVQRQIGTDWLVSASYLGNSTTHLFSTQHTNPAIFLGLGPCTLNGVSYATCSTTANTDQRRRLSLELPQYGQYFGFVNKIDTGGKANYNGLLVSVQRRAARGVTVNANYTWSHCISDPGGDTSTSLGSGNGGYTDPSNRHFDRGNCSTGGTDRRHVVNFSGVAETPRFSNSTLRAVASNWRFSPILKLLSGDYMNIITSQDRALNGIGLQRVNQILANPYGDKSAGNYLNPSAFALPALGTFGNVGAGAVRGPGSWQFDAALSRSFQLRETKRLEFRAEAFNVTNAFRMMDPTSPNTNTAILNTNTFGQVTAAQDPRIMQFALKYVF